MIEIDANKRMIECAADLSRIPEHITRLYLDFETTSGDENEDSVNPWFHCQALGYAFTWDDEPIAWYVPMRHAWGTNVPIEVAHEYLRALLRRVAESDGEWVNHNIKYDAHVSANSCGVDPMNPLELTEIPCYGVRLGDTLTRAKIIDSDRYDYSLGGLSRDWLAHDDRKAGHLLQPWLKKNKDFGRIPSDVMAEYACQDVLTNRELDRLERKRLPEECQFVWDIETKLTTVLVHMERTGVRVNPTELKKANFVSLARMLQIEEWIHKETGQYVRPSVSGDCYDLLCNRYGLPVLAWTKNKDTGEDQGPSFDKEALKLYLARPDAPKEIIERMLEYRKLSTFNSLFAEPYQTLNVDGVMHALFNQCVRTGRMSCSKPNLQQLSKLAKAMIHPHPGHWFLSQDYCVPAGTMIPTPYGDKPIEEIAENLLPVLSYTDDATLKFCNLSRGARVGFGPIYRITFDDDSTFECTADHPLMRHNGEMVKCKDLQYGDRLAHVTEQSPDPRYPAWLLHDRWYTKHKLVAEWAVGDTVHGELEHVHHKDENKQNWHVDNLEVRDRIEHLSEHAKARYNTQDHEYRVQRLREGLKNRRLYNGDGNPNWQGGKIVFACETCGEPMPCWPSQIKRYCSQECRNAGRGVKRTTFCIHCGKQIETPAWGRQRLYCSNECKHVHYQLYEKDAPNYQVKSVECVRDDWFYSITVPETGRYVTSNGLIHSQSQIEFRVIVSKIQDKFAIKAYNDDPYTDFHEWVAQMCAISRKPAKTVNFMMGYGGGKKRTVKVLSTNDEVAAEIERRMGEVRDPSLFYAMARQYAETIYETYHASLPTLKSTARMAEMVCRRRGYVRNGHGRYRRLPQKAAHKAFNTVCQGEAADIMKERAVAAHEHIHGTGVKLVGLVHDEFLFMVPNDLAPCPPPVGKNEYPGDPDHSGVRVAASLTRVLETPARPLLVPIRTSAGWSASNWAEASSMEGRLAGVDGPLIAAVGQTEPRSVTVT